MRLFILSLVLSASAFAYEGQSCSESSACSGYGEVCVKGYGSFGKCEKPSTSLQGSSSSTIGKQCSTSASCSSGESCSKASKYDSFGKCSRD